MQDERSKQLLEQIALNNTTVSGDTRFDRVWANAQQPKSIPGVAEFKNSHKVFIAGSTWPEDEKLIATLVEDHPDLKFIIAPHEIGEEKINNLAALLPDGTAIRYSRLTAHPDGYANSPHVDCRVLIVDNIGMLSSLYQYGDIAYIGGGFGAGIHNTLEAAAYGLPVIFGPNYKKFIEANELIAVKAGFSIADAQQLKGITETLATDKAFYNLAAKKAGDYVNGHTGATATIVDHIKKKEQGT